MKTTLKALAFVILDGLSDIFNIAFAFFVLCYGFIWLFSMGGLVLLDGTWFSIIFCLLGWIVAVTLFIMWLVDKVKEKRDELERISKPHTSETTICPGCRNKIPLDDYEWHIWSCDKFYKYAKQSPK